MDCTSRFLDLAERMVESNYQSPQHPFRVSKVLQFHKYGIGMRFAEKGEAKVIRKVPTSMDYPRARGRANTPFRMLQICDTKDVTMGLAVERYFNNMYRIDA